MVTITLCHVHIEGELHTYSNLALMLDSAWAVQDQHHLTVDHDITGCSDLSIMHIYWDYLAIWSFCREAETGCMQKACIFRHAQLAYKAQQAHHHHYPKHNLRRGQMC